MTNTIRQWSTPLIASVIAIAASACATPEQYGRIERLTPSASAPVAVPPAQVNEAERARIAREAEISRQVLAQQKAEEQQAARAAAEQQALQQQWYYQPQLYYPAPYWGWAGPSFYGYWQWGGGGWHHSHRH